MSHLLTHTHTWIHKCTQTHSHVLLHHYVVARGQTSLSSTSSICEHVYLCVCTLMCTYVCVCVCKSCIEFSTQKLIGSEVIKKKKKLQPKLIFCSSDLSSHRPVTVIIPSITRSSSSWPVLLPPISSPLQPLVFLKLRTEHFMKHSCRFFH